MNYELVKCKLVHNVVNYFKIDLNINNKKYIQGINIPLTTLYPQGALGN